MKPMGQALTDHAGDIIKVVLTIAGTLGMCFRWILRLERRVASTEATQVTQGKAMMECQQRSAAAVEDIKDEVAKLSDSHGTFLEGFGEMKGRLDEALKHIS